MAMIRALEAAHTADVAEAYARGERCLSVVYGPLETPDEQAAVDTLSAQLWGLATTLGGREDQLLRSVGRDDRTTWWWRSTDGAPADVIAGHAEHLAHQLGRSWWQISQDPQ